MTDGGNQARGAAAALLDGVLTQHRPLSELTGPGGPLAPLDPASRARAQRLALATLRHLGRADAVLKPMLRKPPPAPLHTLLRLAIVEMLQEGAPPHGVVSATVAALGRDRKLRHLTGLANAVLRRAAAWTAEDWTALPPQKLPGWLRGRLQSAYGRAGVEAMEAIHARQPPLDLTARGDPAALAGAVGGTLLPTGSVRLTGPVQVSALPGYAEGALWVQDAAAALPAKLLSARPGERVLDLCAAPGGKTMQLAATGAEVGALDMSGPRLARLQQNLARTGLGAEIVAADALDWQPEALFDAVLLDAPCSATGTIRRHPDLPHVRSASEIKPLVALQAQLIDRALALLVPGGRMIYCTCSVLPDEGEAQLAAALARHPGLQVVPPEAPWVEPDWRSPEGGLRLRPDFWPARGGMDGFYIAGLAKPG